MRINNPDPDVEILEEASIAMAQAIVQRAADSSGLSQAEIARRVKWVNPQNINRLLRSNNNITIRTLARVLAVCGYRVRFELVPRQGKEQDKERLQ